MAYTVVCSPRAVDDIAAYIAEDSEAYAALPVVNHRIFFQIDGEFTGRRIDSYEELLPEFARLAAACKR